AEPARQMLAFHPRRLVLMGRGENSIFETLQSLPAPDGTTEIVPVVMDVRARAQLRRLFADQRPDAVFHAAAHKHVPFMERSPEEAVMTNVIGTRNILTAPVEHGVGRFVFISTAKAVIPPGVRGATKRVGDLFGEATRLRWE